MTDVAQVYETAGRAIFRHKDSGREIGLAWGAGYPPIDLDAALGGEPPADFERQGDDPAAGLVDVDDTPA